MVFLVYFVLRGCHSRSLGDEAGGQTLVTSDTPIIPEKGIRWRSSTRSRKIMSVGTALAAKAVMESL